MPFKVGEKVKRTGKSRRFAISHPESYQKRISSIDRHGNNAPGNRFLKTYLEGGILSLRRAVTAKCADCCGFYADGKVGCGVEDCPLYPWMPYRGK